MVSERHCEVRPVGAAEEWVQAKGALEARAGPSVGNPDFLEALRNRNPAWDAGGKQDVGTNADTAGWKPTPQCYDRS